MAEMMLVFSAEEVHRDLPYAMICMTREGAMWNTMHRKRRWKQEFSEAEREAATEIFRKAHAWLLTTGVPEKTMMSMKTYRLWQKLGDFCATI